MQEYQSTDEQISSPIWHNFWKIRVDFFDNQLLKEIEKEKKQKQKQKVT